MGYALATKMYEERLKLPLRDSLDDAAMKVSVSFGFFLKHKSMFVFDCIVLFLQQKFGENVGQLLDPNPASILKSAAAAGQPSGYFLCNMITFICC